MLAETGKVEMANALFHTQAVDGLVKEEDELGKEEDGLVKEEDGLIKDEDGLIKEEDGLVKEETTKKSQIAPSIGGKGNSTKKSKDKHKQSKW